MVVLDIFPVEFLVTVLGECKMVTLEIGLNSFDRIS